MSEPWMQTYSGKVIELMQPKQSDIVIVDIAHALGNICRFGGHSRTHFSVAQHSVLVSQHVPEDLSLCGLLHDAAEAYLGDVISPLKSMMPEHRQLEDLWLLTIGMKFGLGDSLMNVPRAVKLADLESLATEKRDVVGGDQLWDFLEGVTPWKEKIAPWSGNAETEFLFRFQELT